MNNSLPLIVTIEHERIRSWAEQMGFRPALAASDARPYPLALADGPLDPGMREADWDEFFRGEAAGWEKDYSFVNKTNVPELTNTARTTVLDRVV